MKFFPHLYSHQSQLEYLNETRQEATDWTGKREWNATLWAQGNHKIKIFSMGDIFLGFH
jgi:hypothetical protein